MDYVIITKLLEGKSVVQLGESIHMTDEFPRVRLQLIRYMHEELGYDILAFEAHGSWRDLLKMNYITASATQVASRTRNASPGFRCETERNKSKRLTSEARRLLGDPHP